MTREQLIEAIYKSEDSWSCPYACDKPEQVKGNACYECAERQLAEYEQRLIKTSIPVEKLIVIGELLRHALETVTVCLDRALRLQEQEEGEADEHSTTN